MRAKVWADGEKTRGIDVELVIDRNNGKMRLDFKGSDRELMALLKWTSTEDSNADVVVGGIGIQPMLPVRPETFQGFVHQAVTWASIGIGKKIRYSFEDLDPIPTNENIDGKDSPYL